MERRFILSVPLIIDKQKPHIEKNTPFCIRTNACFSTKHRGDFSV